MQSPGLGRGLREPQAEPLTSEPLLYFLPNLCVCRVFFCVDVRCARSGQTYPFRLLIREDTTLSTCCEVAVDLEGVPRAALVWINPVFTCRQEAQRKTFRGENRTFGERCKAVDACPFLIQINLTS
uniref:Uncharacterized protein n=1 Tax=Poecilia mexicana TaxID=48701 RepID=A0A3B3WR72_9TELE